MAHELDLGLTSAEAERLLREHGPNELRKEKPTPWWRVFLAQFKGALIFLLMGACVLSAAMGEVLDAAAIGAILLLNALVGFIQEFRAERAMAALRDLTAPRATVLRDGRPKIVHAAEVVVGDVLVLEAGDVVAADATVLSAHELQSMEAALTGESTPVRKHAKSATENAPLAERHGQVFMGTAIATGTGRARVCATGMATELGKVASLLETANQEHTPLQRQLEQVGRRLLVLCLALVGVIAVLSVLRGTPTMTVFLSSVSLAVAAVPEGLAAIVTIALAIGVRRMSSQNVLVRKLPSVETLGSATVICTDKTGTLTTGVMEVRELWGDDHAQLLFAGAANCDAALDASGRGGTGDPTELAILMAAAARGISAQAIERQKPRRDSHPFDSDRKRMSTFRDDGTLYVKGAVESVLPLCVQDDPLARRAADEMATHGLRVLAVAVGQQNAEENLKLVGLLGIADPPRTEAIEAVAKARKAGIRTVMITGDHPRTAEAIAREMGILTVGEPTGDTVHARATPEKKLQIVRELKKRGAVVAMTGDGVNDAPALKEAHIGIAMGKTGTEVTREAADMILTDDNFASIVAAVREGRGIFDNIRKTVLYILSGNFAGVLVMFGAVAVGVPAPLLPLQLLWINLITETLPALALVMDPTPSDIMERPPRKPSAPMLGRAQWVRIAAVGLLDATVVLATYLIARSMRSDVEARSMAFTVLVLTIVFRAFAARSYRKLLFELGPFTNVRLLGVAVFTVFVQLALLQFPLTQKLFGVAPLSVAESALCIGLGLISVTVLELLKFAPRMPWWKPHVRAPA